MDYFTDKLRDDEFNKVIKDFEQSHPNIKIKRLPVPYEQLLPKSLRQAKTHSLPTILVTDNLNIPTMVAAGALAPIEKFGTLDKSQYLQGPIETGAVDGKQYGVPVGSNDLALFYNKAMLKDAGVTPPKTWDEFVAAAKKLHNGSTYGVAFSAPSDEQATWQFSPFVWANGGDFLKFDSPETVGALKLWQTLVKEGGASQSVVNFGQTQVYNEFAAKRAAMMVMGPWEMPALDQAGIDYGVVPLPVPSEDKPATSPIGGEDFAITTSATLDQQKAAWTYIEWMQDKDRLSEMDKVFGYMPAYKPAYDEFVSQNPAFQVFAEVLKTAQPLTASTGEKFPEVSDAITTALQKVLSGGESAEQAAKEAQDKISQITGK